MDTCVPHLLTGVGAETVAPVEMAREHGGATWTDLFTLYMHNEGLRDGHRPHDNPLRPRAYDRQTFVRGMCVQRAHVPRVCMTTP